MRQKRTMSSQSFRFSQKIFAGAGCLAIIAGTAMAFDVPKIWCWETPDGDASSRSEFVEIVRLQLGGGLLDPEDAADAVTNEIWTRELASNDICILLQNYGNTHWYPAFALWNHPDDAWSWAYGSPPNCPTGFSDCDSYANGLHKTAYFGHGILDASAWTQAFCDRYEDNAESSGKIDTPSRFHFDSETANSSSSSFFDCVQFGRRLFSHLDEDGTIAPGGTSIRWSDPSAIHGFGSDSLEDLFEDFKDYLEVHYSVTLPAGWMPAICASGCFNVCDEGMFDTNGDPVDIAAIDIEREFAYRWRGWYNAVIQQSRDAALGEAAYDIIRATWQGAKCSNYDAVSFDGVDGRYVVNRGAFGAHPANYTWPRETAGDFSAPVFYFVSDEHYQSGEDIFSASLRVFRKTLDAIYHSYSGDNDSIAPWHAAIGQSLRGQVVTADFYRDLHALMRAKRVTETMLWWDPRPGYVTVEECHWDDMASVIDEVWGFEAKSVSISAGSASGLSSSWPDLVSYSTEDYLAGTCYSSGLTNELEFEIVFDSILDDVEVDEIFVNLEATAELDAIVTVYAKDQSASSWVQIGQSASADFIGEQRTIWSTGEFSNSSFVSTSGVVELKLHFDVGTIAVATPPSVDVDLVQLIAVNPSSCTGTAMVGDLQEDGYVDLRDLEIWLTSYDNSDSHNHTRYDINNDGRVDLQDLADLISAL